MANERTLLITNAGLRALNRNPLTKVETAVLWHLAMTLPVPGAAISHVALGKEVSVTNIKIGRTMKRFCENGFLVRGARIGLNYHYKLNPLFFRLL
ncbi:MAG TPA: hypothetical protein DCP92_16275 [Nitrospiraceae bacterium]|nr:hypothetical protein [Nitrospiraceae bacterium]